MFFRSLSLQPKENPNSAHGEKQRVKAAVGLRAEVRPPAGKQSLWPGSGVLELFTK